MSWQGICQVRVVPVQSHVRPIFALVRDVPSQEQHLLLTDDESESSSFVVFDDGVGRVIVRSKCQLEAMRDAAMNG